MGGVASGIGERCNIQEVIFEKQICEFEGLVNTMSNLDHEDKEVKSRNTVFTYIN